LVDDPGSLEIPALKHITNTVPSSTPAFARACASERSHGDARQHASRAPRWSAAMILTFDGFGVLPCNSN
jgi:hypothetical protein